MPYASGGAARWLTIPTNILRAVVALTVRGDDEAAPLASRAGWQQVERQQDPREQLALFARLHRQICDREAAVFAQAPPHRRARRGPAERACARPV
jgi:hypothetical protein